MSDSDQIETFKEQIREYFDDGVISEKEEFAILLFGREAGLEENEITALIAQVEKEMGLDGQNSGLVHLKMLTKKFLLNDGIIDENELFVLQSAAKKLGMTEAQLESIVAKVKKQNEVVSPPAVVQTDSQRKEASDFKIGNVPTTKPMPPRLRNALIAASVILLSMGIFARFYSKSVPDASVSQKSQAQPSKLIYRMVKFDKYIVAGNAYMEENKKLSKGFVRYIQGHANVSFDLSKFRREQDGTLSYIGEKIEGSPRAVLPYTIDVIIQEENNFDVYDIKPTPISQEEAKAIGVAVGAVGAAGGGYLGMQAGGIIGKTISVFQPELRFAAGAGTLAGGALGAGAGAIGGYALCGKYLTGLTLTKEMTEQDKQNVTEEAKKLIAAELFFDPVLQKEFSDAFFKYIRDFYRGQIPPVQLVEGNFINIRTQ